MDKAYRIILFFLAKVLNISHLGMSEEVNFALNKLSTQSSDFSHATWGFCVASRANDGIYSCGSWMSITALNDYDPFWFVDLGQKIEISHIVLYRRLDCIPCANRWDNLYVGVSNNPMQAGMLPGRDFRVCTLFRLAPPIAIPINITCDLGSLSGRYVSLTKTGLHIELCEAEVYGKPSVDVERKTPEKTFIRQEDVRSTINVLQELTTVSVTRCAAKCVRHDACVALSFIAGSCVLHNLHNHHYLGTDLLQVHQGAIYMSLVVNN